MEFFIDFIDNADHDKSMTVDAPTVAVAEDMVHAAHPNSTIMYISSEADYELYDHDEPDESMDGDHASALASCGWGTDEDYGDFGDDYF